MSSAQEQLAQILTDLYATFSSYALNSQFGDCSWLTIENAKHIKSTSVKELIAVDLNPYVNHLWYCGNEGDLKYLLPRLFELFSAGELDVTAEMFLGNLPHKSWPENESRVVDLAIIELWKTLINSFPFLYTPDEFLCGLAQTYSDLDIFFNIWDENNALNSLRQLALLANQATYCGSWQYRPIQKQQLIDWLCNPHTIERLEKASVDYSNELFHGEFYEAAIMLREWKDSFHGASNHIL